LPPPEQQQHPPVGKPPLPPQRGAAPPTAPAASQAATLPQSGLASAVCCIRFRHKSGGYAVLEVSRNATSHGLVCVYRPVASAASDGGGNGAGAPVWHKRVQVIVAGNDDGAQPSATTTAGHVHAE
jgi:hypothetical protein